MFVKVLKYIIERDGRRGLIAAAPLRETDSEEAGDRLLPSPVLRPVPRPFWLTVWDELDTVGP